MNTGLSTRLAAAAELVPCCATLADIGTDHGFLPLFLLKQGIISYAICTDIRPSPLEKARGNFSRAGLSDCADFRLGNGLDILGPHEADAVVIAGMGGETIANILSRGSVTGDRRAFILQPMTKPERLRKFLSDNGFAIDNWRLCREKGRIRECLRVKKATPENALRPETDPLYLRVGRKTPETAPLYPEYIHNARRRLEKELHGKTSAGRDLAEIEHIRQLLERLSGLLA